MRRIRFLGLFDTVNSVPRFENAWMQRSKFPYTANSSALTIRHAVSIDERRSKFRQDLMGESKHRSDQGHRGRNLASKRSNHLGVPRQEAEQPKNNGEKDNSNTRYRRSSHAQHAYRRNAAANRQRSASPARSLGAKAEEDGHSMTASSISRPPSRSGPAYEDDDDDDDDADEALPQDIKEMWFPGCHAVCDDFDEFLGPDSFKRHPSFLIAFSLLACACVNSLDC